MFGFIRRRTEQAPTAAPITERATATIERDGRLIVIDVIDDCSEPNPWEVLVDFYDLRGRFIDSGPSAQCYEASLDVCNADTLLNYWSDEVIERSDNWGF